MLAQDWVFFPRPHGQVGTDSELEPKCPDGLFLMCISPEWQVLKKLLDSHP